MISSIVFESQQGMMITDDEGKLLRVNSAFTVNRRAILSRLVVETASNSFHLSVSPSSVLAGGIWSVLHGYNL
jgi:hypothetical protein